MADSLDKLKLEIKDLKIRLKRSEKFGNLAAQCIQDLSDCTSSEGHIILREYFKKLDKLK